MYPPEMTPTPEDPDRRHAPELERALLRRSVLGMLADRSSCSVCRRALLVGERFGVLASEERERAVCELCLATMPDRKLGDPVRVERVRASERALIIKRAAA
jgi:hypothetical protein